MPDKKCPTLWGMQLSSALVLDGLDLSQQSSQYPVAFALAAGNVINVRPAKPKVARNPRNDALITEGFPELYAPVTICPGNVVPHKHDVYKPGLYQSQEKNALADVRQLADQEWPIKVKHLRASLQLSQGAFAKHFHNREGNPCSAQTVSNWERGASTPAAENFIQMGNMAEPATRLDFWALAGVDIALISSNEPARRLPHPGKGHRGPKAGGGVPPVPPALPAILQLPIVAEARNIALPGELSQSAIADYMIVKQQDILHPEETVCIPVPDDSMATMLEDGYIAVVDMHPATRESLVRDMVVVRDDHGGVTIRWLRRQGRYFMLQPQRSSAAMPPVVLDTESPWKILGRVMFWVGRPSKYQKEGLIYPAVGMKLVKGKKT